MRRRRSSATPLLLVAAMVLAAAGPAAAGQEGPVQPDRPTPWEQTNPAPGEVAPDLWFVEFAAEPRVRGGSPAAHARERTRFRAEARADGIDFASRRDFTTLWNGLSVQADAADAAAMRSLDSVHAVYPVAVIQAPDPDTVSPDLATALTMTGADVAQSELGLRGEGLAVAVIDTGMDYNHPDLGGDGDASRRLEADAATRELDHPRITHGWDYVGEEFDASDPDSPPPAPDPDPMDIHGHGTHVGGIVGADAAEEGGATGVAPGVTFGAYKVFATGSTTADIIVDALEDAYADGMDIVNMSLGAAFVWGQEYPTTRVSNELANQGVVVVNSAGNSGGAGAWTLSAPANAHDIISVASADNLAFEANFFEVAQLDDPVTYMEMSGAELPPTEGTSEPLAWLGRACVDTAGDELLDDPAGKVALIRRGDCTFAEKYTAAAEAGATGVVIANNVAGMFAGTIGDAGVEGVWSAGIGRDDGTALVDLIEAGETVRLGFTDETTRASNPTGGLVSSFSSYGQEVELAFGPTIMAPGGLIRSTWPLARGGYATISGTSMAAPHVAGAAALLLEAEPDLDPFEVRDRLQNTAEPANWSLNPGLGFLDHTFRQGAGLLRIDRTVLADHAVVPGQLALADAPVSEVTLTLTNRGDEDVTYTVGHVTTLSIAGSSFTPGFYLGGSSLDAPDEVTVPAGGSAEVTATITAPAYGIPNHQYGGYILFTEEGEDAPSLRVPYSGFDGTYTATMGLLGYWANINTWVDVDPFLSRVTEEGDREPVEEGYVYDVRTGDIPVVEPFFGHFPQQMELWAVKVDDDERLLAATDRYLRRSEAVGTTRPILWDGRVRAGDSDNLRYAPSGTYVFELRVLRALGDPDNPDHWEVWTSPEFGLDTRAAGTPGQGGPRP